VFVKAFAAGDVGKIIGLSSYDTAYRNIALITLNANWQRVTNAATLALVANGTPLYFGFVDGDTNTQTGTVSFLATGVLIEDTIGQVNTNPSEPVSHGVLSAPFHGAGVGSVKYFSTLNANTVASNIVTEATGAPIDSSQAAAAGGVTAGVVDASGPLGYLAEGARTNRLLYSQTWENAVWVASNVTKADNSAVAPNGTSTAATLTATAGNGTVIQDLGVVANASKTGGTWIKRKTGTGNIDLTMDGGTGWTTQTVTAGWTRISKNQTLADEDFGIRIVTSGDAVYVWNGQVETATFLSSDIPATTVAVTRAADVDQYVSAGNVPTNDFVVYGETAFNPVPTAADYYLWGSYVDADNSTSVLWDGTNLIARKRISGTSHDATIALAPTAGTVFKWAARFTGTTGTDIFLNGAKGTNDATNTACQIGTNFQIGADGDGANQPFSTSRRLRINPKALSNGALQSMTS